MIVTIDGPAGAGKSSVARELARRLQFDFLDTGAMYRAVAYAALADRLPLDERLDLGPWLAGLALEATPDRLHFQGRDISELIRTPEVTSAASRLAVLAPVRQFLVRLQRSAAVGRSLVTEGRDQGSVVFPEAACKFFLVADRVERARRRHQELQARGSSLTLEDVLRDQDERDQRDEGRDLAPLKPAPDAIVVDSTHLTPTEVVGRMEDVVRRCLAS